MSTSSHRDGMRYWLGRYTAAALLGVTVTGLAAGGIMRLAGAAGAGNAAWLGVGVCGAAYALWAVADSLRRGRAGVDVIALLALAGAIAVGELLAAAVISVMLASGRALEGWAAGRADRDLQSLLQRAPRSARRYREGGLETVPLDEVVPGDIILVAPGSLVPVDGTIAAPGAGPDAGLTGCHRAHEPRARRDRPSDQAARPAPWRDWGPAA